MQVLFFYYNFCTFFCLQLNPILMGFNQQNFWVKRLLKYYHRPKLCKNLLPVIIHSEFRLLIRMKLKKQPNLKFCRPGGASLLKFEIFMLIHQWEY